MSARYAIFFCPEDSAPLSLYGERVLGRTAIGNAVDATADDFPDRATAADYSATPAHYGFHATLKAPFHLRNGQSEDALLNAVDAIAQKRSPIVMRSLEPRVMSGYAALAFSSQPSSVKQLASQCVEQLEEFRAPLTSEDIQRRQPGSLSEIQQFYLHQYGYPFVLSEFQFHMTLTGSLHLTTNAPYFLWLEALYKRLVLSPPLLDCLAVFWQPDRENRFTRIAQFPFN